MDALERNRYLKDLHAGDEVYLINTDGLWLVDDVYIKIVETTNKKGFNHKEFTFEKVADCVLRTDFDIAIENKIFGRIYVYYKNITCASIKMVEALEINKTDPSREYNDYIDDTLKAIATSFGIPHSMLIDPIK